MYGEQNAEAFHPPT